MFCVYNILMHYIIVTKEELEHMYQKFKDLKVQDEVASIHFEQFEALLYQYFPFWREALPDLGEVMYRVSFPIVARLSLHILISTWVKTPTTQ